MTQEQVEKLLQPRYKVIADYPRNKYYENVEVGEIIEAWHPNKILQDNITGFYGKYPHIFKELEWWEEREIKDMPMYLKQTGMVDDDDNTLPDWCFKVKKHFNAGNGEWRDNSIRIFCTEEHPTKGWSLGNRSFHYSGFIPATEQDYLTYKQNQLTV